jgi:hypothetical protein
MRFRVINKQDRDGGIQVIMCTQGRYKRRANLYNCTCDSNTLRRVLESDIILFNRTFYIHIIKRMHIISKQTIPTQPWQFTQASRPSNEQADCRPPHPTVTNQRVIIVIKGEIWSVDCCLWSEPTSLGTSDLEGSAWATEILLGRSSQISRTTLGRKKCNGLRRHTLLFTSGWRGFNSCLPRRTKNTFFLLLAT